MKKIILSDYVQDYLRDGHLELEPDEEQYKKFESMLKKRAQLDNIKDCGDLEIDSYRVEDYETEKDFEIYEED